MRLTERDRQVIQAVYTYRILRRDQIQRLFFPSSRTANRALARLFQHGFLERRFLPTALGEGDSQCLYLLGEQGADLVAQLTGKDREDLAWQSQDNTVGTPFLAHGLAVNDVRIAIQLAAAGQGWTVERWIPESELKSQEMKDYVQVVWQDSRGQSRRRRQAVVADSYFILNLGGKRAHFFLEVDQATMANKRWADKIRAYVAYTESGQYQQRYQTRSLRILTVTTGERRLQNLKSTTEAAGGQSLFWFTTADLASPEKILREPIWQVAGRQELHTLID